MPKTTSRRRAPSSKKAVDELEAELDEALEDEELEDLDEEIEDELDEDEDEIEAEAEVETPAKPKKDKAPKGFVCASVVEKHGEGEAKPCYTAIAPFRTSPARNLAFQTLQDAGKSGLSMDDWIGEVATTFEEQNISGSAKGAVSFIQKATKRVTIQKLAGGDDKGNYVVVEPLADKSRRTFNKNGTVRSKSK